MFTLSIETGNAAFHVADGGYSPGAELARLLRQVAQQLEDGHEAAHVRDMNGNRVGEWEVTA